MVLEASFEFFFSIYMGDISVQLTAYLFLISMIPHAYAILEFRIHKRKVSFCYFKFMRKGIGYR